MIMIVATFGQAVSGNAPAVHILGVLIVWRFIVSIPLKVLVILFSNPHVDGRWNRWRLSSISRHFIGICCYQNSWPHDDGCLCRPRLGQLWQVHTFLLEEQLLILSPAASLVAFIITVCYKDAILASSVTRLTPVDYMWRLLIGLGCVPGCIALYFRLTIPETPRFTMDIERNIDRATHDIKGVLEHTKSNVEAHEHVQLIDAPKASWADFRNYFGQPKNFKILFGTSYSWFALDVSFFFFGL